MMLAAIDEAHTARMRPAVGEVHRRAQHGDFLINGRFLAQPMTGVQRYAREIVAQIDSLLEGKRAAASLVVPRDARVPNGLKRVCVARSRLSGGLWWEQMALPRLAQQPLINLCNTAPLLYERSIVCIHDCNVFEVPESYGAMFRLYYRALQPLLVRFGSVVTTVSRYSAASISRHFGLPLSRIQVLSNGHEHALAWDPGRATIRSTLDACTQPFVLLIGSLARHKNIGLILGLSDRLKELNIRVKIVGSPSSIFAGKSSRRWDNVDWLGRVDDNDLALLLDRALCLAFPSLHEGFGLPVLEAMARGCPVVSSNCSSLPEICGGAAILVSPNDPGAWLRMISRLAVSPALQREMSERGLMRSRTYSWRCAAEGYLELVSEP